MDKLELYYPLNEMLVTQRFGENYRDIYKKMGLVGHNGLDLYALDGTKVYAAHDGLVTFAGEDGSAGMGIVLRTLDEKTNKDGKASHWKTIYWHLRKDGVLVRPGTKVKAGDLIGLADNTGLSIGSHLHFGLKPIEQGEEDWQWGNLLQTNGYNGAVNPEPYFNGFRATDSQFILQSLMNLIKSIKAYLASRSNK